MRFKRNEQITIRKISFWYIGNNQEINNEGNENGS